MPADQPWKVTVSQRLSTGSAPSTGEVPREGDSLDSEGLRFEVVAMDGARIERLRVTRAD